MGCTLPRNAHYCHDPPHGSLLGVLCSAAHSQQTCTAAHSQQTCSVANVRQSKGTGWELPDEARQLEEAGGRIVRPAQRVVVEGHAVDAAIQGEHPRLWLQFLGGED